MSNTTLIENKELNTRFATAYQLLIRYTQGQTRKQRLPEDFLDYVLDSRLPHLREICQQGKNLESFDRWIPSYVYRSVRGAVLEYIKRRASPRQPVGLEMCRLSSVSTSPDIAARLDHTHLVTLLRRLARKRSDQGRMIRMALESADGYSLQEIAQRHGYKSKGTTSPVVRAGLAYLKKHYYHML